jgi:hypothetical protein
MVAILVAASSAAAANKKNNYSAKLKRKTATTNLLKTVFQIHYKMGNDTSANLKRAIAVSPRTHLSHASLPCQAEEETQQHKLTHTNCTQLVAAAPS